MRMIQITEEKAGKMSDFCEKMLHYGGKLMSCLEELEGEASYGQRGGYYGERMGMRDPEEYDDMPMYARYGQRGHRRDSMGRFM